MSESVEFDARDHSNFHFHATPLRRAAVGALGVLHRPVMALRVLSMERVPDEGPLILVSNHVSNLDPIVMQLATPRPIFFMGKAELFKYEPFAAVLRDFGVFPVYRGEKDDWALRHARKVLDAEQILGMFPEGHRSKGRGLGLAKTGTARLAIEAQCPILPIAITGTDDWPKTLTRRTPVSASFLPLIYPQHNESAENLIDRLMTTLAAALPASMRGVYR